MKDLKSKKHKEHENAAPQKIAISEQVVHSPIKIWPTKAINPLFDVGFDDSEVYNKFQRQGSKIGSRGLSKIFGKILRIRLIKSLNKMKQLKLNPRDVIFLIEIKKSLLI